MTVEPMTDAMVALHESVAGQILAENAAGIVGVERSYPAEAVLSLIARIRCSEAERDAAVAQATSGWRYLATWADVHAVETRHNSEPAPGLYIVWKPGWPYPSAASIQFGVFATDEDSPAPDDYLMGAWVIGPLRIPGLPTAAQEGQGNG